MLAMYSRQHDSAQKLFVLVPSNAEHNILCTSKAMYNSLYGTKAKYNPLCDDSLVARLWGNTCNTLCFSEAPYWLTKYGRMINGTGRWIFSGNF